MTYSRGEVVFLSFPYTSGGKAAKRPALVVLDTGDADVLVARVTSQQVRTTFDVYLKDWAAAGLRLPSIARLDKLLTIEKSLVMQTLGKLTDHDRANVKQVVEAIFSNW